MSFDPEKVMEIRGPFHTRNEGQYAKWLNEKELTQGQFLEEVKKVSERMHEPKVFADYKYIIEDEKIPGFKGEYEQNGIHKLIFVCVVLIQEGIDPYVRTLDNRCREILQLGSDELEKISTTSRSIIEGMRIRGGISSSIADHQPKLCMRYAVTLSLPRDDDPDECLIQFISGKTCKYMVKGPKDRSKHYTCVAEIEQTIKKVFFNPHENFTARHLGPLCKFIFHVRNYRTYAIRFTDEELLFEIPFLDHFPMLTYMVFYCKNELPENLEDAVQEIFHESMDQFLKLCIDCLEKNAEEFNMPVNFQIQEPSADGAPRVTEVRSDSNLSVPEFCKNCYDQVMLAIDGPQGDLVIESILDCNVDIRWTDRINYYSTIAELLKVPENHVRVCAFIAYWQMYNRCTSEVTLMEETARKHLYTVLQIFEGTDTNTKKTYLYTFCYLGFRLSFIGNGLENEALNFQVELERLYSESEYVSGKETENPLSILTTICAFISRCVNSPYKRFKDIGVNLKDLILDVIFMFWPLNQFAVADKDNGTERVTLETFQDFIGLYLSNFSDLSTNLLSLLLDEDIPKIGKLFREQPLLVISDICMAHGSSQLEIRQNNSASIKNICNAGEYFEIRLREAKSFDHTSLLLAFLAKQSSLSNFGLVDAPEPQDELLKKHFKALWEGVKSFFKPARKTTRSVLRHLIEVRKNIIKKMMLSADDAF